jgi:polar amino acid transport system substrate-binding protein
MKKEDTMIHLTTRRTILAALGALLLAGCASQGDRPAAGVSEALRKEFAPSGTLRAGVNFGNNAIAQRDPAGGPPRGVGPSLARELARQLGVPIAYVTYDAAGKMGDSVKEWDVAMLAGDPKRAETIAFSAPYVNIEGSYLVRADSPYRTNADIDRKGTRISVGAKSGYDLYLSRQIKQAELVRFPTSPIAADEFIAGKADVAAGVKNHLLVASRGRPDLRLIEPAFMTIGQAAGVPQGRPNAAAFLRKFIEEQKANGFVARALRESNVTEAVVAPAARP